MPKMTITPLATRLFDSAPEAGDGLNAWLIKGARECQRSGVKPERAFALIANTVVARGGGGFGHDMHKERLERDTPAHTNWRNEPTPDCTRSPHPSMRRCH